MPVNDVVVLASGGIDSTVLAHKASRAGRLHSLFFIDWGQPAAEQELAAVSLLSADLRRPIQEYRLALFARDLMAIGSGRPGPRVIPGRNLAFVACAINYAASLGSRRVWIGATADDAPAYPDCRITFIDHLRNITRVAYGVTLHAPFYTKRKAELIDLANDWGINLEHTWSCYEATTAGTACGLCDSCAARRTALDGRWCPA